MCSLESHCAHQWSDFNLANGSILPSLIEMVYPDLLVGFFLHANIFTIFWDFFFKYIQISKKRLLLCSEIFKSQKCYWVWLLCSFLWFSLPHPPLQVLFMVFEANVSFSLDLNRKIRLLSCWVSALSLLCVCADRFESRQMRHEFGQIK